MYDTVIKNGFIIDGTGSAGYYADIGIIGDRIAGVGNLESAGIRVLDAEGCIVSPGFIDIHSHTDESIFLNPTCESKVTQGVTTEVSGNCGYSPAPCGGNRGATDYVKSLPDCVIEPTWRSMGEWLDYLDKTPMTINYATLVGHGTIRSIVVGYDDREPTEDEMRNMQTLVSEAMKAGAFGLSSGLIYPPGCYAGTDELVGLCSAATSYKGIYSTHIRSESNGLIEAVDEAISIGRRAGIGVQLSHHKASDQCNWGKVSETLSMIDKAREDGLDIWADQYPYVASCTDLWVILPSWAHDGGKQALIVRLRDPGIRNTLREWLLEEASIGRICNSGGWEAIMVNFVSQERNRFCEGLNIARIAEISNKNPADVVLDLLLDEDTNVGMIHFVIDERDVKTVMKHPAVLIGSDATARSMKGPMSKGKPHPRSFGTFPRVLGHYVREQQVLPLENAVAKMTGRSAKRLSLRDRGVLAEGYYADITVFDPETIEDTATFVEPHSYADGIKYVMVNGGVVVDKGVFTGATRTGRVLRHSIS